MSPFCPVYADKAICDPPRGPGLDPYVAPRPQIDVISTQATSLDHSEQITQSTLGHRRRPRHSKTRLRPFTPLYAGKAICDPHVGPVWTHMWPLDPRSMVCPLRTPPWSIWNKSHSQHLVIGHAQGTAKHVSAPLPPLCEP